MSRRNGRVVSRCIPFDAGCLPLSYSGNPGVNVDSYRETPAVTGERASERYTQCSTQRMCYSHHMIQYEYTYSMYCGTLHLGSYIRRASQTPLFNVLPPPVCHHRKISDPQVGKLPCTCIMQYHALYGFLRVNVLCIMHVHGGIILLVE